MIRPPKGYAERMEHREKSDEPNVQRTQDTQEREEQRREEDTKAGAKRPDTGAADEPPQPFTGPHH